MMITPEYVDKLIGLHKRSGYPIVPAVLRQTPVSQSVCRFDWIAENCPLCGGRHAEYAGEEFDETHKHLGKQFCVPSGRPYIMMREYDACKLEDGPLIYPPPVPGTGEPITPERVDELIRLSRAWKLPIASAVLQRTRINPGTITYDWVITKCPICRGRHTHPAGYSLAEVHRYLERRFCSEAGGHYMILRKYDAAKLEAQTRLLEAEPTPIILVTTEDWEAW